MKRFVLVVSALVAVVALSVPAFACEEQAKACGGGTCGDPAKVVKADDAATSFDAAPAVGAKAVCPITGEVFTVSADTLTSQYEGRYYAFCCAGCKPKFDADPAKYAKGAPKKG